MVQDKQNEPTVTLSDIFDLCKHHKKKILRTMACTAAIACFIPTSKPVYYWTEGTFRDKGSTAAGMSETFNAALVSKMGVKSLENEATTTMKSRTLLKEVVKKLDLNGSIEETNKVPKFSYLTNLASHIYSEYRLFFYRPTLFFKDIKKELSLNQIIFDKEEPYGGISIYFTDDEHFELTDKTAGISLEGKVGKPITTPDYSFIINKRVDTPLAFRTFEISLRPTDLQVAILSGLLNIKADKEDKTLVRIECLHPDRHMVAKITNTLMDVYQDFKKEELKRIAKEQLSYLSVRHIELNKTLSSMMSDHAKGISKDLMRIGFPNAQTAIDFLSNNQSQQEQRLLTIDLEIKRLEQAKEQGYSFFDHYTPHGDPGIINHLLGEIRELKKQSDNLQLTLYQGNNRESKDDVIAHYMQDLEQLNKRSAEAEAFLQQVKNDLIPDKIPETLLNPKYLIKNWWNQLKQAAPSDKESVKTQAIAYIQQLIRLFDVHAHTLNERLIRHQDPHIEFEGVDLVSAKELYLGYSKQLNELEAQTIQHEYILGEIKKPEFEITSLGTLLTDPVSHEMITQTSRLTLQMNETYQRSSKEQQRIKEEIDVKKGFLAMHLKNATQLLHLKQNLLKNKIHTLQETTLALLQQQISLLEKHLSDYLVQRIQDLRQEREVIASHQQELNAKMATLPEMLAEEKLIDQKLRINAGVSEEVSRLIESKHLASNLEVSRSGPVEIAVTPIKPKSPKLIFFMIFGAFMGLFFHITYLVTRSLLHGIPVSINNLRLSGYNVAGELSLQTKTKPESHLQDQELETLREAIAFLPKDNKHHTLLISENGKSGFSSIIAKLLSRRGSRVLIVDLSFDKDAGSGVMQYVTSKTNEPIIKAMNGYDLIEGGAISRFSNEIITSKRFQDLFKNLKEKYEWIIAVSYADSFSSETKELLPLFDYGFISLEKQTLQDLPPAAKANNLIFLLMRSNG